MRELFEGHQTDDPVEAARRAVRPRAPPSLL